MADWSQRVAFITGGARGMGKGHMEALLERGAKVYFVDVNPVTGSETYQELKTRFSEDKVHFSVVDVTNRQQFKDAFDSAISIFGHVDIMVNNAGVVEEKNFDVMIGINLSAVVYGTYLALEHMRKDRGGRGGRIVNVSSLAGLVEYSHLPVYGATKQGVRAFTSTLAIQPNIEEMGVEFAVLCPDATNTDLLLKMNETNTFHKLDVNIFNDILIPVSKVSEGLLELLESEKMNGAILAAGHTGLNYRRMENVPAQ